MFFNWFRRKSRAAVQQPTEKELFDVLQGTYKRVVGELEDLKERHSKLEAAFKSFRGQVYAWRGKLELEDPAQPTSLQDPKLSKAQVKAALGLTTPHGVASYLKKPQ
jgi:predicted nuclease with TOPRIM domain